MPVQIIGLPTGHPSGLPFLLNDDILLQLGNDGDQVLVNRSTALGANTALTGVLLGTPVTPAIAANSLILANNTASGDILIAGNLGGNSRAYLFVDVSADTMDLMTAGVSRLFFGAAGQLDLNDGVNANMTLGLTINQGGADNEIFALKSSADVAHGMTTITETDSFAYADKRGATTGGLQVTGLSSGTIGIAFRAFHTTDNSTKSIAGTGAFLVNGAIKSGTDVAALGVDANIIAFQNGGTTRFILDGDGDSHQDVGTAWTNFDSHDDLALLTTLAHEVARPGDPVKAEFHQFLKYNRRALEAAEIVTFNEDGHHFVNMSRLTMLLVGTVRQLGMGLQETQQRLAALGAG